ncbi:MAG: VanZ family protein [Methylotetracoccus sp.]
MTKPIPAGRWHAGKWRRYLLIATGLLLLFGVMVTPIPLEPSRGLLALENAAHPPLFGLLAIAALHLFRTRTQTTGSSTPRQYVQAWLVVLVLGAATELAQMIGPRESSLSDFVNDLIGATMALSLYRLYERRQTPAQNRNRWGSAMLWALFGLCLAAALAPLAWTAAAYLHRNAHEPALADFDTALGRYFVMTQSVETKPMPIPSRWRQSGDHSALWVEPVSGPWPGVTIEEPLPDWAAYRQLVIDVTNPGGQTLDLAVRIDDRWHNDRFEDRYNGRFLVAPESRTELRVPVPVIRDAGADRPLDMHEIRRIIVFQDAARSMRSFYLNGLRLIE